MNSMFRSNPSIYPLLLQYDKTKFFVDCSTNGLEIYINEGTEPIYSLNSDLLLVQGIATSSNQAHLVVLKSTGELCYIIISDKGHSHSSVITKFNLTTSKVHKLYLLPLSNIVHIFYAQAHTSLPEVWKIGHFFWNGQVWRSAYMGEVVHVREPLYFVTADSLNNVHLIMITSEGKNSVVITNRFSGSFNIWSKPTREFTIAAETVDAATIMTLENTQYLYWISRALAGNYELYYTKRPKAQEVSSKWNPNYNLIQASSDPVKNIGIILIGNQQWLLVSGSKSVLLKNSNEQWIKIARSNDATKSIRIVLNSKDTMSNSLWRQDMVYPRRPLFWEIIVPEISNDAYESQSPLESYQEKLDDNLKGLTPTNWPLKVGDNKKPTEELNKPKSIDAIDTLISTLKTLEVTTASLVALMETKNLKEESGIQKLIEKQELTQAALERVEQQLGNLKQEKKGFWRGWLG